MNYGESSDYTRIIEDILVSSYLEQVWVDFFVLCPWICFIPLGFVEILYYRLRILATYIL